MELTAGDLEAATGALLLTEPRDADTTALRARPFHAVAIDSRQVTPGDLFVALPGAHTDGAHFGGEALARGALAVLTSTAPRLSPAQWSARLALLGPDAPGASLVAPDPLLALQRAARAWRERHDEVTVVGVTGSVGKTTTREAIAGVLTQLMPTLVSPRSYNNEIGLPVTLLGLERRHRAAVLEMGMYAPGEIALLAELARPAIGVMTMVAPVHLERLGSIEAIAAAKAELIQALPAAGAAVLNGDDARVRAMSALTRARPVYFGLAEGNDWRATEIDDRGLAGFAFTVTQQDWSARITSGIVGRHFVHALLAAAAVAAILGCPREAIAAALARVSLSERQRFLEGPQNRLIIDDSWNASVPSMLAALDVLAAVPRRRVAVLGEMLELGPESEQAHRTVGRRAGEVLQALVTVGQAGLLIAEEARQAGLPREAVASVATAAEAPAVLEPLLRRGDGVLVKGSRGLRLEGAVQWLLRA